MEESLSITCKVNKESFTKSVAPRLLLSDFLRHELDLTGTHVGCEHGVCGACTILMDGEAVRSCLLFAVQADGHDLQTVEGLANSNMEEAMHPIQEAFREAHGLQCGFCTPGMIMVAADLLSRNENPTEQEIRESLEGNYCRCTGYHNIVRSIQYAANKIKSANSEAIPA